MKRLLMIPLLAAALLLLLAACDTKDPADTPAEDTTAPEVTDTPTETPTDAPVEKKGCGSVVGFGVTAVLAAMAAAVAMKKKDE